MKRSTKNNATTHAAYLQNNTHLCLPHNMHIFGMKTKKTNYTKYYKVVVL